MSNSITGLDFKIREMAGRIKELREVVGFTYAEMAQKTGAVVTAEEHNIYGGLGSAVAEVLVENCPVPMARVGVADKFGESGLPDELLEKYGLTAANIAAQAKAVIAKK